MSDKYGDIYNFEASEHFHQIRSVKKSYTFEVSETLAVAASSEASEQCKSGLGAPCAVAPT